MPMFYVNGGREEGEDEKRDVSTPT